MPRYKCSDTAYFARQLSSMLRSGLTITKAFSILVEQIEDKGFKDIVKKIQTDIEEGNSVSTALSRYPAVFSSLFVSTVKVGEETGRLDDVFERMAVFLEKEADLKAKIKSALSYPSILIATSFIVILFLVMFVFPKFVAVFTKSGVALPAPTRIIYGVGRFIRNDWYFVLIAAAAALASVKFYIRTENGRYNLDRLKLKIPVFGKLFRKVAVSRFSRSMEMMLKSGLDIIKALNVSRENLGNVVMGDTVNDIVGAIRGGERFAKAIEKTGEFPMLVSQVVSIGEETGELDKALGRVADGYDQQVDYAVKNLTTMLEPLLVSFMAVVVGFIALSLFLPIFDMMNVIK